LKRGWVEYQLIDIPGREKDFFLKKVFSPSLYLIFFAIFSRNSF